METVLYIGVTLAWIVALGSLVSRTSRQFGEQTRAMQLHRFRHLEFEDNNLPELIYELKGARLYL